MSSYQAYGEPTLFEHEMSRIACLRGELDGTPWLAAEWRGFHPRVYGRGLTRDQASVARAALLDSVASLSADDLAAYTLELQMWVRNERAAAEAQLAADVAAAAAAAEREAALAKLTAHDRQVLGLE